MVVGAGASNGGRRGLLPAADRQAAHGAPFPLPVTWQRAAGARGQRNGTVTRQFWSFAEGQRGCISRRGQRGAGRAALEDLCVVAVGAALSRS